MPAIQARVSWRPVVPMLFMLSAFGCHEMPTTPNRPPSQAFWALKLNQHAVNLALIAPYNTVQLTAIPLNAAGSPLTNLGRVIYTTPVGDSSVTVDSMGLVMAHSVIGQTKIIAKLQDMNQNVTHSDTVRIQVISTPPLSPLTVFSIHPAAGDSAKRSLDFGGGNFPWLVTATDLAGNTVCNAVTCELQVYYTSSDPSIATIDPTIGLVTTYAIGHVKFTATTIAYGVVKADSVDFTVGYKLQTIIYITLASVLGVLTLGYSAPRKIILGVGATVTYCNQSNKPVDVIFDAPTAIEAGELSSTPGRLPGCLPTESGNILLNVNDTTGGTTQHCVNQQSRSFPKPGLYHYHSALFPSDTYEIEIRKE